MSRLDELVRLVTDPENQPHQYLGLHKSISGAAGIDKKYGEQDYQFAQRNALRTCMFNAITIRIGNESSR